MSLRQKLRFLPLALWIAQTIATTGVLILLWRENRRLTKGTSGADLPEVAELRRRNEKMQEEYRRLQEEMSVAKQVAREEERLALFDALVPLLTQLPSLQAAVRSGAGIPVEDVIEFMSLLPERFGELGFAPIGQVGERTSFDPRLHLPAGDADASLRSGDPVEVRFVGYRYHDRILQRALVVRARGGAEGERQSDSD